MDRRHFVAGAGATIVAGPAHASIAVDRFGSTGLGRSVILLHGSDGLTNSGRYEFAAQMIAAGGYTVWLPRYFEATGDRRARYGEIKTKFPIWLEAIEAIKVERQNLFAVVGFSLGGALALAFAARDSRIRAVVDFSHSRYIEAAAHGILIGCIYLPNGNPAPGPKFEYKLRWFERLQSYAEELLSLDVPAALVGDFNVMPTELDVYAPDRWREDALFRPEVRKAYANLLEQGWVDAVRRLHPGERIYTFWKYWRNSFERDAGLRIDHFLLSPALADTLKRAEVRRSPRGWGHTSDHAPVIIEF